jgi:hypothetical protein
MVVQPHVTDAIVHKKGVNIGIVTSSRDDCIAVVGGRKPSVNTIKFIRRESEKNTTVADEAIKAIQDPKALLENISGIPGRSLRLMLDTDT